MGVELAAVVPVCNEARTLAETCRRLAAVAAVRDGSHDVVVIIPSTIGDDLSTSVPVRIEVISDQSNTTAERNARRASRALVVSEEGHAVTAAVVLHRRDEP